MLGSRRLVAALTFAGLVGLGIAAAPSPAHAWWRAGWCCGVGFGVVLPPVVVAPAPVYAPPPVAYYPPRRPWIPPHWEGPYWVPGHWG